jgi:excisionase family DNA binding protein
MPTLEKVTKGMLTVNEAAQELGLRPGTIRAWLLRRQIGCVRLSGRCVRIPWSEIDKIISAGTVPAREVRH